MAKTTDSPTRHRILGAALLALICLLAIGRSAWGTCLDNFTREALLRQIAAIDAGTAPDRIASLRNPWLG